MGPFIHIITTRFNVPTENWEQTRAGFTPLTDEWHTHRFELFQKYTFPSFKNQTNKNFVWLVFFDVKTDEKYLKIIKKLQNEYSLFNPIFVNDGDEINSSIRSIFKKYFSTDTAFVISTDIDNDDFLHRDFVDVIQKLYQPKHDTVIDLRCGFQLELLPKGKAMIFEFYGVANPFVSLVEDINYMKTIMNEKHLNFRNYNHIISYDEKPMFIQLIHSHNLLNSRYNTKAKKKINLANFGLSKQNRPKVSVLRTNLYNMSRYISIVLNIIHKK